MTSVALLGLLPVAAANPQRLADVHDALGHEGCLNPTIHQLHQEWESLDAGTRADITRLLRPSRADLFDRGPQAAPPPPPLAEDTCWGNDYDNELKNEHFAIQWNDGDISESDAQKLMAWLEDGWRVQVEELGWRDPDGINSYLMPIMIERGNYPSAYTYVENCRGNWLPYIVIQSSSFYDDEWAASMAVHEFNHALQFAYGFATEFWYAEATAIWMETQVYEFRDWTTYIRGYSDNPHIAMSASSQQDQDVFWHMYGMAVWPIYLDEYQGGPDIVRQTWEVAASMSGTYTAGAEDVTTEVGIDFDAAYLDFIARVSVMDFENHDMMPRVAASDTVSSLPAEGESGADAPEGRGQNFIKIKDDLGKGDLKVTVTGEDANWALVLAEVDTESVLRVVTAKGQEGEPTELILTDYGDETVYLIVSPLKDSDTPRDYQWRAELIDADAPDPEDDTEDDNNDDPADEGKNPENGEDPELTTGCGCNSQGAPVGGLLLAGLAVLGRRRR